ncbi:hypothetical protein H0I23_07005 [Cellulophaga sp. HaHaR_3_176]|uniref:hypothetical protein n=1 Tax=Cellulophaga sp. HaHaR_3_176 TaxID=1942464 RepID=UPI001C1F553F|nr:hypothetical protein [Cellulophaga sp. HaHaR_3_176]QWX85382.1 hypothetical protein H0I23_07005 [Cellulophaga sp. HaHaR_3_176]
MKINLKNIFFSFTTILLLFALAIPNIAKVSHTLFDHKEITCLEKNSVHFHETEFNCEFYKYQLSTYFSVQIYNYNVFASDLEPEQNQNYYFLLSEYQNLHFSLRGPPLKS